MARKEVDTQEEIVRLLVAQLRLQLGNQSAAIIELSRAGFGASRIADLLGTTPGTVNVALQRAKRHPVKKAPSGGPASE
jgi:DNA-directed RNA polymerase specialized sigma24 family protein